MNDEPGRARGGRGGRRAALAAAAAAFPGEILLADEGLGVALG